MIQFQLKQLKKSYSVKDVLKDITFKVKTGDRIGLIGQNGSGKSTIFRIIMGEKYDSGHLILRKNLQVVCLDQIPEYPNDYTTIDVLNTAFQELNTIKKQMSGIEDLLSGNQADSAEKTLIQYGKLQEEFEKLGGYEIDTKREKICTGLKINTDIQTRLFSALSGGEKTRVVLGMILLKENGVMLLDEPTNHLDMDSLEWLEGFLQDYRGSALIISHDRYFLDRSVNKILELDFGEIDVYRGNYSEYLEEKDKRLFLQFEQFKNQQKKIKKMQEAIKRFRDWGNQSGNPKMFKKAANMEKRIERIEKVDRPQLDRKKMKLDFQGARSGKDVLVVDNLHKSFEHTKILKGLDCHISLGDQVAVVGNNGSGKSTLFKLITGEYIPDKGDIKLGSQVKYGVLEQEILFEKPEESILEYITNKLDLEEGKARAILAKFLFFRDDVFKKIGVLSGGEKVRLKFCELMHQDLNFLLLDEPTNHLDIDAKEVMEESLLDFKGTILFISHDRYFINKMADRILFLGNGHTINYNGNFEYFKQKRSELESNESDAVVPRTKTESKKKNRDSNKLKTHQKTLERKIEACELKISDLNNRIEENPTDYQKVSDLFKNKDVMEKKLEFLMDEWMEIDG